MRSETAQDIDFLKTLVVQRTEDKTITNADGTTTVISQSVYSINCDEQFPGGDRIGIRCPECIMNGETSRVSVACGMITSIGLQQYHDESGEYHSHDPNVTRTDWECSNGHVGDYQSVKKCPAHKCETGYRILKTDPYYFRDAVARRNYAEGRSKFNAKDQTTRDNAPTSIAATEAASPMSTNINYMPTQFAYPGHWVVGNSGSGSMLYQNEAQPLINIAPTNTIRMQIVFNGRTYAGDLHVVDEPEKK